MMAEQPQVMLAGAVTEGEVVRTIVVEPDGSARLSDATIERIARAVLDMAADSLSAAWAEVESALPEGWVLTDLHLNPLTAQPAWRATALGPTFQDLVAREGETKEAALRALALALRERQP